MYKIDPVKATCMKYANKDHGIQGLNDTCFGICAAFSGTNDVYNMDPACSKSCTNFIEKRKREIFGVGSCDHQVPYRPVIWQQIPRYIPALLNNGDNKEQAKIKCFSMCEKYMPNLTSECKEACIVDYNAVTEEEYRDNSIKQHTVKAEPQEQPQPEKPINNYLWIPIAVFAIIVGIYMKGSYTKYKSK